MMRLHRHARAKPSLLGRYSETLGELALRRQTEFAILAAKAESDLANRAKSAFLGTMSHELRTPLNAIIGFSDLIQKMKPTDETATRCADYATHIGDAGRHLLEVISDILDISKIESGTFALNTELCAIAEIIADTVPIVARRFEEKRQILEVRVHPGMPRLKVDPRRIRQILINLLSNASKFTPDRGRVLLLARANRDGGATVAVVDSGVGMTPDQIAVALTPFGQVQSHLSRTQEGTGLGLPIARGLARQHGGDLYLESEPNAGTSAVLTLPGGGDAKAPAPVRAGGGERRKPRKPSHSSTG